MNRSAGRKNNGIDRVRRRDQAMTGSFLKLLDLAELATMVVGLAAKLRRVRQRRK